MFDFADSDVRFRRLRAIFRLARPSLTNAGAIEKAIWVPYSLPAAILFHIYYIYVIQICD